MGARESTDSSDRIDPANVKGIWLMQKDDKVICCVDSVCEEFQCIGLANIRNRTLLCDDKVLKTFSKLKTINDMPLAKA